jgi:hypothetical protein
MTDPAEPKMSAVLENNECRQSQVIRFAAIETCLGNTKYRSPSMGLPSSPFPLGSLTDLGQVGAWMKQSTAVTRRLLAGETLPFSSIHIAQIALL